MSGFRAGHPPFGHDGATIGSVTPIDETGITQSLSSLERMQLELGRTPADLIGRDIEDIREQLMETLKMADRLGVPWLHAEVANLVLSVDDLRRKIVEQKGAGDE